MFPFCFLMPLTQMSLFSFQLPWQYGTDLALLGHELGIIASSSYFPWESILKDKCRSQIENEMEQEVRSCCLSSLHQCGKPSFAHYQENRSSVCIIHIVTNNPHFVCHTKVFTKMNDHKI